MRKLKGVQKLIVSDTTKLLLLLYTYFVGIWLWWFLNDILKKYLIFLHKKTLYEKLIHMILV